jgi:hypothetical protein
MRSLFQKITVPFFILLVASGCCSAQNFKEKKIYTVNINENESLIKAEVFAKANSLKRPDSDKTYYWYSSNKILSTKGSYEGKLLHGKYTSFYLNDNLREKGHFKFGLKHGKWFKWYNNGAVQEISEWKKGDKHGVVQNFNANGELTSSSKYYRDKLNGKTIIYASGKIVAIKKYKNGIEIVPVEKVAKPPREKKVKKDKSIKNSSPGKNPGNKSGVKNPEEEKIDKKSKPDAPKNETNLNEKKEKSQ